jgi:hypothetical protein
MRHGCPGMPPRGGGVNTTIHVIFAVSSVSGCPCNSLTPLHCVPDTCTVKSCAPVCWSDSPAAWPGQVGWFCLCIYFLPFEICQSPFEICQSLTFPIFLSENGVIQTSTIWTSTKTWTKKDKQKDPAFIRDESEKVCKQKKYLVKKLDFKVQPLESQDLWTRTPSSLYNKKGRVRNTKGNQENPEPHMWGMDRKPKGGGRGGLLIRTGPYSTRNKDAPLETQRGCVRLAEPKGRG